MPFPPFYEQLKKESEALGFTMPSDPDFGSLLQSLAASKPSGNFLELGTGTGLSLSWMAAGMDKNSTIISLDNEPKYLEIAQKTFGSDKRISINCTDGSEWITKYSGSLFDLIFADTWPGKFTHLSETLALVAPGGFYVIDDLNPQENWPEGHEKKVEKLIKYLNCREDFYLTQLDWSTGIIIMTKKSCL